jgi:hypothetical protein
VSLLRRPRRSHDGGQASCRRLRPRFTDARERERGCEHRSFFSGLLEGEPGVLPRTCHGKLCQIPYVAPDRWRFRLRRLCHRVGVEACLRAPIQRLHHRLDHLLACLTELLGGGSREDGAISGEICVERRADLSERVGPGVGESTQRSAGAGTLVDTAAAPTSFSVAERSTAQRATDPPLRTLF